MNILMWNVGGLQTSLACLRRLIQVHNLRILVIIELNQSDGHLFRTQLKLCFTASLSTCRNKIWIFWNLDRLSLLDTVHSEQATHVQFLILGTIHKVLVLGCL